MFSTVSVVDAINFTFFAVIFIVTGLRLVCRKYVSPSFGVDDVFVVLAVVRLLSPLIVSVVFIDFSIDSRTGVCHLGALRVCCVSKSLYNGQDGARKQDFHVRRPTTKVLGCASTDNS